MVIDYSQASLLRWILIQAANRAAIRSNEDAPGKCLFTSVQFALAFSQYIDLRLVRWNITDDVDYREHWAVQISAREVIDLTHVQVDGNTEVLHAIDSYPSNYIRMKEYPVSVACGARDPNGQTGSTSIGLRSAPVKMRWAMFRYDLQNQAEHPRLIAAGKGLLELTRFTFWLLIRNALLRLEQRQHALSRRLGR